MLALERFFWIAFAVSFITFFLWASSDNSREWLGMGIMCAAVAIGFVAIAITVVQLIQPPHPDVSGIIAGELNVKSVQVTVIDDDKVSTYSVVTADGKQYLARCDFTGTKPVCPLFDQHAPSGAPAQ